AFLLGRFTDAVDKLAVDGQFDDPIHRNHIIGIPLALPLTKIFNGFAPFSSWIIRYGLHPSHPEQLPMNISDRRLNSIPDILVDPLQFKHRNFDSVRQPTVTGDGTAPYKSPGVAAGFHMSPFYVHDEIFVLFL